MLGRQKPGVRTGKIFSDNYLPYSNLFWNNGIVAHYEYKHNKPYDPLSSIKWFDLRNNRFKIHTYYPEAVEDINFQKVEGYVQIQNYNCHKIYIF